MTLHHYARPRSPEDGRPLVLDGDGRDGWSDLDLLTLILGSPRRRESRRRARRVLETVGFRTLAVREAAASWEGHLTPQQSRRLHAALELARRLGSTPTEGYLRTPQDVADATADLRHLRREHFVGLYLNTRNRLLAREEISVGCLNASIVHPREVFEPALRLAAASLIVVHNHPSGDTEPSRDDLAITRRLVQAGDLLGIALLDHVIVGRDGHTSLKDAGYL